MPFSFLLLSGGLGARAAKGFPKQFYKLNGHPMVAYSIIAAEQVEEIDEIVINFPEGFEDETRDIIRNYASFADVKVVPAGVTRHESIASMLEVAKNDRVILHEAARPLVTANRINNLIDNPQENVSFCEKISFSLCKVDLPTKRMVSRVDRDVTMNIQLPQKFLKADLAKAHAEARKSGLIYTEDAMLVVEVGGRDVFYQDGWSTNLKVTTPEDFQLAEAILSGLREND